jgi:sterol desaturase/sphingolipid hydroxylase (fatty acid hydroxylase superfamily)
MLSFGLEFFVFQLACFAVLGVGSYWFFWKKHGKNLKEWKIQPSDVRRSVLSEEALRTLSTFLIWNVIAIASYWTYQKGWTRVYHGLSAWDAIYFVLSFFIIQFIHDTYFYWTHRLYHAVPWLKKFHMVHHRSLNPTPFSSMSFHPVEAVLQGIYLPILIFFIPLHPFVIFYYYFFLMLINCDGHLGYEFWPTGLYQKKVLRHLNTSTHHNMHHTHFDSNFGLYYNVWDSICGTNNSDYFRFYDALKERTNQEIARRLALQASTSSAETLGSVVSEGCSQRLKPSREFQVRADAPQG